MSILVTGGLGYIGSHTVIELLQKNMEVVILDNLHNSKKSVLDSIEKITNMSPKFYENDLCDYKSLVNVFNKENIDQVIHFAGLKSVAESNENPLLYYENNIIGTLNLLEIMKEKGIYKLVFSSSATVYGNKNKMPLDENSNRASLNPYGRTKLMIEKILEDLCISDERWKVISLRYFNPVGAHISGLIGEDPKGKPNNLMPIVAKVARGELKEVQIFGDDYSTKDGTGVRDYIHIADLALGHLKALEEIENINGIEAFNLGTGNGYSVLELIKVFEKENNIEIPYKISKRRSGDVDICYSNPKKAQDRLKWKATKGIKEMCKDTWAYECGKIN